MAHLCEWGDCDFTSDDFDRFYGHVREHTTAFYDGTDTSLAAQTTCTCLWRECFYDSCENIAELLRHVLFHGYHARLKQLGQQAQAAADLSPCSLDSQTRNLVPEFSDEFCCEWVQCDVVTCCPKFFYRHVQIHTEELQKEGPFGFVYCKWKNCQFGTKKRNKLKEHCRTHTHEKCFSCPNCGGLFSNKTKFMDHIRRQNTMESESYQCSHCFKFCASERILRDHMRQHVNHVRCSLCNMTCPTKSALEHHLNFRHSDEKPYPCNMCDNSFKTSNDLRRHQQTHDPVYNFSCEVENCSYVTKTLNNLRRHYKVNHEDVDGGRYECHVCGRRYSRGAGLTKHLKKQHTFRWPSGHTRFRYKEHDDGMYRLQTVRFESVELSQQLDALENEDEMVEGNEAEESHESEEPNHQQLMDMTSQQDEVQLHIDRQTNANNAPGPPPNVSSTADSVNLPPPTTHQHLLDMLNQFTAQCHQTGTLENTTIDRNVTYDQGSTSSLCDSLEKSSESVGNHSREEIAAHAVLDLQEAASLLAQLRESGMAR